jgi:hypothetical protein
MQFDGKCQIFSELLFGKVEATVIQTTILNHINQCKNKKGNVSINANMFVSLLICLIVKSEHLSLTRCKLLIDWCPLFYTFLIPILISALAEKHFRIDDGAPIMANNHPAIVKLLEQQIIS